MLLPHAYVLLRYLTGKPWPDSALSDPTLDQIPVVVQFSWILGMLAVLPILLFLFMTCILNKTPWYTLLVSAALAVLMIAWIAGDPGGVFTYLSD